MARFLQRIVGKIRHEYKMCTSYSYRFGYLVGKAIADGFMAGLNAPPRDFQEYMSDPETLAFIERCERIRDMYFPDEELNDERNSE